MTKEIPMKDGIKTRNIAILFVEPAGFAALFTKGAKWRANTEIHKGLPKDAVVETIFSDPQRAGVMIVLRSDSFRPVMLGEMPPILPIEIKVGK